RLNELRSDVGMPVNAEAETKSLVEPHIAMRLTARSDPPPGSVLRADRACCRSFRRNSRSCAWRNCASKISAGLALSRTSVWLDFHIPTTNIAKLRFAVASARRPSGPENGGIIIDRERQPVRASSDRVPAFRPRA